MPAVLGADWEEGWLATEWIEGRTVRGGLDLFLRGRDGGEGGGEDEEEGRDGGEKDLGELMGRIGRAVGRLHDVGVCHGDLTTSNLMLRQPIHASPDDIPSPSISPSQASTETAQEHPLAGEVIIIDFGLAVQTVQDEDRAVDLYVLERAFGSTHPQAESLFPEVLRAYGESFKGAKVVLRRLEDVRLRGRKKSMIG